MKKKITIIISLLTIIFSQTLMAEGLTEKSEKMNVATYNIRLQTPVDSDARAWNNRKIEIAKLIKKYKFDIFGVQEVGNQKQEDDLKALIPDYTYFGKGRDNQMGTEGEQIGVFYRTKRFTIRDYGYFFLSPTPEAMSIGWDAAFRRMCVWTKLYDLHDKKTFFVFCTHFDHVGVKARIESAKLIVEKTKEIAEDSPFLLVGDLNTSPESSEMYKILSENLDDSRKITRRAPVGSVGTFNNFDVSKSLLPLSERIDYIFSKHVDVYNYHVINDRYSDKTYPSDHFPLMIECKIEK
ncbi:MAG: endonuclease/exonuclease/phosphatase family protein [Paludibacter sp.]|nr:endonuclease/exonuclease/phosphatase family protein [Paludibacter sp.]